MINQPTQTNSFVAAIVVRSRNAPTNRIPHAFIAKVGARVRQLCYERNMSLADVANASGISKGHLSSIEHGLIGMTLGTVERFAKALEISPMYVYAFPEDD